MIIPPPPEFGDKVTVKQSVPTPRTKIAKLNKAL